MSTIFEVDMFQFVKKSTYTATISKLFQRQRSITTAIILLLIISLLQQRHTIINHFHRRPIDIHGIVGYPEHLPRAHQISGRDFLSQYQTIFSTNNTTIPHIIHQAGKTSISQPSGLYGAIPGVSSIQTGSGCYGLMTITVL